MKSRQKCKLLAMKSWPCFCPPPSPVSFPLDIVIRSLLVDSSIQPVLVKYANNIFEGRVGRSLWQRFALWWHQRFGSDASRIPPYIYSIFYHNAQEILLNLCCTVEFFGNLEVFEGRLEGNTTWFTYWARTSMIHPNSISYRVPL